MKPLDAANRLREVSDLIARGAPLPLHLRHWICRAFEAWQGDSTETLDRLLGLVSRSGGKLHAKSKLPARDQAIRAYAGTLSGCQTDRARIMATQFRAQRQGRTEAPVIADMRLRYGRLPESVPQLSRILAGRTAASESLSRATI